MTDVKFRVEDISQFKGQTLRIDFEGHEPIFISSEVVVDLLISKGKEMSEEDIEAAVRRNDYRRARERALYLLDERDYGYAEMFRKLEKNYPEDICYEVVNNLSELNLIDDRRYAFKCAEYFLVTKKRGKFRAREDMRQRGIPRELIDEALAEFEDGTVERLIELVSKKYARKLREENGLNKVKSALARQGYSYDDINAALSEFDTNEVE